MDRRHFLRAAIASGAFFPVGRHAWAAAAANPAAAQRKLIVVMLRGAVDGLNVAVPWADPDYQRARPTIALGAPGKDNGVLDLNGYFGLHPALNSLMPFWQEKKLAFVHASGSPDPSRSHFDAQDYMESGTPGRKSTPDGWMNRLLAALPATQSAAQSSVRALNLGTITPRIFAGPASVANLGTGKSARNPRVLDRPQVGDAFAQLYAQDEKLGRLYREGQAARKEVMASLETEMQAADNGAPLPNGFPNDAATLAKAMRSNPAIQLAFVALGGWDTHAAQGNANGQLANRLEPVGRGLAALVEGLGSQFQHTTIVVMSEFGRTVRENGNRGTDHGHGNAMWILGGGVAGGRVLGEWPGLGDRALYEGRDLAITTDFRHVLTEAAEQHLRVDGPVMEKVFPGMQRGAKATGLFV
jgi:uncharacterized protein (DUF1501 family)